MPRLIIRWSCRQLHNIDSPIWCLFVFIIQGTFYTMGHKKRASFIFEITLANMDRFLPCDAMHCTVLVIIILSVRLSVCIVILSVRPSVRLVNCVHMVRPTIMISSPYGSPVILVSRDITFIPKFEGDHPAPGRWMRVGWVRIGDFRPISRRISETVRDTTKVTINH